LVLDFQLWLLVRSGLTAAARAPNPSNVRGYNCGSMIGGKPSLRCALILAVALWGGPAAAQEAPGRIIATVTTLEGTVRMTGVMVELRAEADGLVIARTESDGAGRVEFPDVPPGRYVLASNHQGFLAKETAVFDVRAGQATEVLFDIQLEFEFPEVTVRGDLPSPTDSIQPVSVSDMLSGSVLESAPLEGDDFQSLLPLLPGVVRGTDGRLRIRGGEATQGALQISAASLIDPSTGDFDLQLPGQSVDSVEILTNPFAAEYGRFSSSITQIRTRRGTNDWEITTGNWIPRFRGLFQGIRGFEPRLSVRGPLRRDRAFMSVDTQFRYLLTPVKSLPDEPEIKLTSFDSFARFDFVLSANHSLGAGLVAFPREVANVTMNTFRPEPVTPDFNQSGFSTGVADRYALGRNVVLESTVSIRRFEINVNSDGQAPMTYSPETQIGSFFNDQERDVSSFQWVEALNLTRDLQGQHVFKIGTDFQRSSFHGASFSRPVEVRRLDGSLAELTHFGPASQQSVSGYEFAAFVQDRWRMGSRVTLELGLRFDRDAIVERVNWSPRAGMAVSILPEGRGILRGGYGKFVQRTPLNLEAFPSYEPRVVTRFGLDSISLGPAIAFAHVLDDLHTPEAYVGNAEWDQRFGRRLLSKVAYLQRMGSHEYVLTPLPTLAQLRVGSTGESRYKELEWTTRYLGGGRRDLTFSYVWAKATADLNNYDQFYGNFRNPIIRANEHNLTPHDVRHRVLVRGNIGLPWQLDFAPVLEVRSGFPWSAVDDYLDFVGPRNRTGRLPTVGNLDFQLTRPLRFRKYRFKAGIKLYNVFGASAARDVQNHLSSPFFGQFFNPIERSIGFSFASIK
jgi:Carboxypeptidase regulatory-like domain/TonB dependent receptor